MVVVADPAVGTVTVRLSTATLVVRGALALGVGVGVPLLVQRTAPDLVVLALLATAAAAAWMVVGLGRTVVLDDHSITIGVSRRAGRTVAWDRVDSLAIDDQRLVVTTSEGRRVRGPRCRADTLAAAREDAALLGLVAARDVSRDRG